MRVSRVSAALTRSLDTILTSAAVSKPGHDGPMEPVSGKTSPSRREMHGALANKRAADSHALALLPIIRELGAAGFISRPALADELNRRGIPTARGGHWHRTTVVRMLTRLGLLTPARAAGSTMDWYTSRPQMREPRRWLRQFAHYREGVSSRLSPSRAS
jgi:hypothetical protein